MEQEVLTKQTVIDQIIDRLMRHDDHLSYSSLMAFRRSPKEFIDYKLGIKEETDAMVYGSMVHCLVLEPDEFENRYAVLEDTDICNQIGGAKPRATKAYKEWRAAFEAENQGKTLVSQEDYEHAKRIAINVKSNRASAKVLAAAPEHEKGIEWEYNNFRFKGFIDAIGDKAIFDLKTCADAAPDKFQRDLVQKGYYLQAAMYLRGINQLLPYYIIAVDKKGGVSVHQMHNHLIEHGLKEYDKLMEDFNRCILLEQFEQSYDFFAERFDGIYVADKPAYLY